MRHNVSGYKLKRDIGARKALLKGLVTSVIEHERIITTVPKAKAAQPLVEKMITLAKRGDVSARRQALSYMMTREAVDKLFDTIGPRFGDRQGGYLRIIKGGFRKGDGGEIAFIELLGSEKFVAAKRKKSAEVRSKRVEAAKKAMEDNQAEAEAEAKIAEESKPEAKAKSEPKTKKTKDKK